MYKIKQAMLCHCFNDIYSTLLPDDIFSNQKLYIGIFYGYLSILRQFDKFYVHLVYFVESLWVYFPPLW
jgi:hypothetical protein